MKDSTRRALRTAYHGLLAVVVGVPTWIPLFDTYVAPHLSGGEKYVAFGATVVAFATGASKVINKLEDAGLVPAYLKNAPVVPPVEPVSDGVDTPMGAGNDAPPTDPAAPAADTTS